MIILSHATMPDRTQAILTGNKIPFLKAITQDARDLEMLGVENIAIPCNTSHYFLEDIQKSTSVPIINMVEEQLHCSKSRQQETALSPQRSLKKPSRSPFRSVLHSGNFCKN